MKKWLASKYYPHTLTLEESQVIESGRNLKFNYIARDTDNQIFLFDGKPKRLYGARKTDGSKLYGVDAWQNDTKSKRMIDEHLFPWLNFKDGVLNIETMNLSDSID